MYVTINLQDKVNASRGPGSSASWLAINKDPIGTFALGGFVRLVYAWTRGEFPGEQAGNVLPIAGDFEVKARLVQTGDVWALRGPSGEAALLQPGRYELLWSSRNFVENAAPLDYEAPRVKLVCTDEPVKPARFQLQGGTGLRPIVRLPAASVSAQVSAEATGDTGIVTWYSGQRVLAAQDIEYNASEPNVFAVPARASHATLSTAATFMNLEISG